MNEPGKRQGFQSMLPERRREIARMGGKKAHETGRRHSFTPDEAKSAGQKGGLICAARPGHMALIGAVGGRKTAEKPGHMARIRAISVAANQKKWGKTA